jgi:excisionase family DNA binding protein
MGKHYFTTNDIAQMCNVTRQTVINWIKGGKVTANLTPGGHRRVLREDLVSFFQDNRMDISIVEEFEKENRGRIPYCWEYHAVGFPSRSSQHECERCITREAYALHCYALVHALGKERDACHTGCENCGYYKRYGAALRDSVQ